MKAKFKLKAGLILIYLILISFHNNAFTQQKYLLVLDIQDFPKKNGLLDSSVREMIKNVNTLISQFNADNVIYIKAAGKAISITSKGFSTVILPAPDFDSTLNIVSSNIFIKVEGDAFTSPEFISFLESKNIKEIVLVGLMADKCIYDTALGGKEKAYDITIVPEGIVGLTPKKKEKAIKKMQEKGIKILPMKEIVSTR